ncbi:MAG TPA: polymorphic toxin-type HINT domain-containing protein, partial [Isosphaeraceae bacterium]|nr:polymorphic toxin-type HINT domain-containing protein [Isosphaeraceae bacterium]
FGADREGWTKWWTDAKGYAYQPPSQAKPTFVQRAPLAYIPAYGGVPFHGACFARGTQVQTLDGLKPIETIQVGDRVLTQDVKTGELAYETVLAPVHNPPAETFRVDLGSETIVATGIHRFWKAGEGWAMVRDLKPGDRVRTVGGVAVVQGISGDQKQPVFNLEVASDRNYFVGKTGFLVHDNSLIETVDQPFDAAPALAAE